MSGLEGTRANGAVGNVGAEISAQKQFYDLNRKIDEAAMKFSALARAQQNKLPPHAHETPDQHEKRAQDILKLKVESVLVNGQALNPGDKEQEAAVRLTKELSQVQKQRALLRAQMGDVGAIATQQMTSHPSPEMTWKEIAGTGLQVSSFKANAGKFVESRNVSFEVDHPNFQKNDTFQKRFIETVLGTPPTGTHWDVRVSSPASILKLVGVQMVAAELKENKGWTAQPAFQYLEHGK